MSKTNQRLALLALLGLGLLLTGCSNEVRYAETGATLEGTVSYGTEKLGAAFLVVQNKTGSSQGSVDENGHYKLENVPLGEVNIAVNTDAAKGMLMGKAMQASKGKATGAPKITEVPRMYHDPNTSGIKTTVNKGQNTFDIIVPKS
jgi:hypothetical protein